ncbi:hypothetical protein OHQ89_01045 [Streptomyces canus]|uniref:hypothetical protein n=1 Tax=Streptomyces canus TaxID=58343 RepID=UPI002E290CE4|nr:hypothetical protein [Streptomyces canus]
MRADPTGVDAALGPPAAGRTDGARRRRERERIVHGALSAAQARHRVAQGAPVLRPLAARLLDTRASEAEPGLGRAQSGGRRALGELSAHDLQRRVAREPGGDLVRIELVRAPSFET